jgi:hypothetical protein
MPLAAVEPGIVLIVVVITALPIGAIVFVMGAGKRFDEIGKGDFAMEHDMPEGPASRAVAPVSAEVREEEIRQMVQARSDRAVAKGREPIDVDAEVKRLLTPTQGSLGGDRELREEVRQLVVARNERRERQGKKPLDVEKEIERQLRDLENLGQ